MRKRKIIKTLVISTVIILIAIMALKEERDTFSSSLALKNIEALAQGEDSGPVRIICWGTGNVVCPIRGELIEDYLTEWSIR